VYKTDATLVRLMLRDVADGLGGDKMELARHIESTAVRVLRRVEARAPPLTRTSSFYAGIVMDRCGIPHRALHADVRASRMIGWCTHILEQGGRQPAHPDRARSTWGRLRRSRSLPSRNADRTTRALYSATTSGSPDARAASVVGPSLRLWRLANFRGMTTVPRAEIEAAFRHQRELNDTQQWDAYADSLHRRRHLRGTRDGNVSRPGGDPRVDRAVHGAARERGLGLPARLDGHRRQPQSSAVGSTVSRNIDSRAEPYQFAGVTILEYAGDGKFSYQEDIYNMKECEKSE